MNKQFISYAYMPVRCDLEFRKTLLVDAIRKITDAIGEESFTVSRAGPFRWAGEGEGTHKVDTSDADPDRFYEVSVFG